MAPFPTSSPSETTSTFSDIFGNDEDLPTACLISSTDQTSAGDFSFTPGYGVIVEDAVAVPSGDAVFSRTTPIDERSVASLATHRGRMLSEQELEDIQRANVNIRAQNYYANAAVNEANAAARNRIRVEELSLKIDTSAHDFSMEVEKLKAKRSIDHMKKPPAQGTFGKDYEVSNYDTVGYETKDYEVSTYKSVYEH